MRRTCLAVAALVLITMRADAQVTQAGSAAAAEVSVGTGMENRELTGAAETFAAAVGKVYCLSRVSNASGSEVEHVWYKGDAEVARVKLMINGSPWRTYSSKNIDSAGDWRCEVVLNGTVLQTARFKVE